MALYFGLVGVQWAELAPHPAMSAMLWLATAFMAFVGAVATHNLIHAPVFRVGWMNDALRVLATLWYGHPVSLFVPVHNLSHHRNAQTRRDVTRTTKVRYRINALNLWFGTRWARAGASLYRDFMADQRASGTKLWVQFRRELVVLMVYLVVLAWLSPVKVVAFVLLPHLFGQFAIKAVNFVQHDGCDYDPGGYNHSRNFVGSWLNWWFMNNGYHTIHHMRPGAHWSGLPELHAKLVAPEIHPALEVEDALVYLWRTFVWPGERLMYDGRPFEFPADEGEDLPWYEPVRSSKEQAGIA